MPSSEAKILDVGPARLRHAQAVQPEEHAKRGVEVIDRIVKGEDRAANEALLRDLCETLKWGSLCALGGFTPFPVLSALNHFPEDFGLAREPAEV